MAYSDTTPEESIRRDWMDGTARTYLAIGDEQILGALYVKTNMYGLGDHVANAGFVVHPNHRGRGVARWMCENALRIAGNRGYEAMQFNYVVSTNITAVSLWQKMGFEIVGTVPDAYRHPKLGLTDVFVMYRTL